MASQRKTHGKKELISINRTRTLVVVSLTLILLGGYSFNIALMSVLSDLAARKLPENGVLNVGIVFSVALIALSALIAAVYSYWASRTLDPRLQAFVATESAEAGVQ